MNLRKNVLVLLFAFLLMAYIFMAMTSSLFVIQRVARLRPLGPDVEVQSRQQGHWETVLEPRSVKTGDWVRTGLQGQAELWWADGTRIRLEPGAVMQIRKSHFNRVNHTETSLFSLQAGAVWVQVQHLLSGDSRFEIQTPGAVAGVRGTTFRVQVLDDRHTDISVIEGQVYVQSGWQEWLVPEEQELQVNGGSSVAPLSPVTRRQWDRLRAQWGPSLALSATPPRRTLNSSLTLQGRTEPGARVLIDGREARVAADGRFEATVSLEPGLQQLEVRALDSEARETVLTFAVQRLARQSSGDAR